VSGLGRGGLEIRETLSPREELECVLYTQTLGSTILRPGLQFLWGNNSDARHVQGLDLP